MRQEELTIHKAEPVNDDWKSILLQPLPERAVYEKEPGPAFTRLAGQILGTPFDETDYYNELYELSANENIHVLSETLDKTIAPETFQALQHIHTINQKEKGLSVGRFVAFLDGEQLIAKHSDPLMHRHLRKCLMTVLHTFAANHEQGLNHPDFRRVLLDVSKFSLNHLNPWLEKADIEREMPKVVWYGDASKSQLYFLYYLMLIGCDVLLFHPAGTDQLIQVDPQRQLTFTLKLPDVSEPQPFPKEKPDRKSTVAYRSTKEIEHVLNHEESMLYKPWQFRDHTPVSVTLKTTYDELFLIAKERAFIRPNFKADKQSIDIPNVFAKIMGVSKDNKEYWNRLHTMAEYQETEMVRSFPFTEEIKSNYQFHYSHALNQEGIIDPDKLMESNVWQYKQLPSGIQSAIAKTISRMCRHPRLKALNKEQEKDVQIYLFKQTTNLPAKLLKLIQTFDYAQTVPKLLLYHTEFNGELTRSDAAALLFLNEIGIDIAIYNPPGHQDIEHYIEEDQYDIHWLEDMVFQQDYKEPSIVRRLFRTITQK
ncbi:YceG family protein [Bacillus atrophaeus]|uniref:YceG family protein n=1 Tax=Bacillus atrophaeus TaxID=1452 RepID=UPI00227DEAB3|nr:YceG family protein [Bacillus atrophaeus]MCY8960279.1 YceG family protein [Bacillus atrophaeus]MCY8965525.1 YceG family protein [Bacillus atrophaeus]MCY9439804.1 YceG family protein [Bacillus atrophaeus]MEC0650015.1 YceG family protein [Bacillus atrophaeus]